VRLCVGPGMAPLPQRNGQQDAASLSSGCDKTRQDIMECMFLEGDDVPAERCHATYGHLCAIPESMVLEFRGRQTYSNCISKRLQKFDVMYLMSPFDVALPHSQESCIFECTCCDSPGDVSGNLAATLNRKIVAMDDFPELLARGSVVEVLAEFNKFSEVPLSWLTILQLSTRLTIENIGLFPSCVPDCRPHELASVFRLRTSPSWWTRTIPALLVDAQVWGAPADFIAEMDAAEVIDSVQEVSTAMSAAHCSVSSLKGNKHMPNQDRAVCASLGMGAVQLLAVLDGHGSSGHVVADVCSEILPKLLLQGLASAGTSFPLVGDADAKAGWLKASADAFCGLATVL